MKLSVLLGAMVLSLAIVHATETPLIPLVVKGSVQIDSEDAPIGTPIVAKIGGIEVARNLVEEEGVYYITIEGNSSTEGASVELFVNGVKSGIVSWEEGGVVDLDLLSETTGEDVNEKSNDSAPIKKEATKKEEPTQIGSDAGVSPTQIGSDAGVSETVDDGTESPQSDDVFEGEQAPSLGLEDQVQETTKIRSSGGAWEDSFLFIAFIVIILAILGMVFVKKKTSGGNKK